MPSPSDRAELVAQVRDSAVAFRIEGAGTRRLASMAADRQGRALSTLGLDRVLDYQPAEMVITLEAGCRFDVVEELLAQHHQRLGAQPLLPAGATLGGLVSADAVGPLRHRFGGWRDQVLGLSVLLADGREVQGGGKVVKNVAGYDLPKLLVGSFGTLGVITELSLRLHPIPEATSLGQLELPSVAAAIDVVRALRTRGLQPASLLVAVSSRIARATVMLALEGRAVAVAAAAEAARRAAPGDWSFAADSSATRVVEFALLEARGRGGVALRGGTPRPSGVLEQLAAIAVDPELGAGTVAFADPGTGELLCFGPVFTPAFVTRLRAACEAAGGFLVIQEGSLALDSWGTPPPGFALMTAIKRELDPARRWNPGRSIGGL